MKFLSAEQKEIKYYYPSLWDGVVEIEHLRELLNHVQELEDELRLIKNNNEFDSAGFALNQ